MQIIYKKQRKNKKQEIYQNELDKALSQHDMAYRDSKDLTRRTASDGYQRGLTSMVWKILDKKISGRAIKDNIIIINYR